MIYSKSAESSGTSNNYTLVYQYSQQYNSKSAESSGTSNNYTLVYRHSEQYNSKSAESSGTSKILHSRFSHW